MVTKIRGKTLSEVLKVEFHPAYNRISRKILNADPTGAPGADRSVADPIGMIVGGTEAAPDIVYDSEEASTIGIVIGGPPIVDLADNATSPDFYDILVRSPCVVDGEALLGTDPAGGTIDMAVVQTTLEALGFVYAVKPTKSTTQTE